MIPLPLPNRRFMQSCWVVADLEQAMADWTRMTGVGPFYTTHCPQHENPNYRGQPIGLPPIDVGMAQAGDMQIELIQQLDDSPSMYLELYPRGTGGFHHVATYSDTYDADVAFYEKAGAPIVYSGMMMQSRVCWVDTVAALGYFVEILERKEPLIDVVFAKLRDAADSWDGKNPVREGLIESLL